MTTLEQWAIRHGVSQMALYELYALYQPDGTPHEDGVSESATSKECELIAARAGQRIWRNNSGALKNEKGMMVRYGLGNTSAKINAVMKSSDYIGIKTKIVTPDMIGSKVGVFIAAEMKRPDWHMIPSDKRAQAQATFGAIVENAGGEFRFITHPSQFEKWIKQ
ncbi:hypothetical protein G6K62_003844 [Salmonella enterica subsp. enterica serovar Rubislaw]|nr:hypothetical protein [Salmonella enterica subsp. enterica serovar Rubislaw]